MPFLLPLLALLLLSAAPTVTEVVTSMSACNAYFLNQKPPQISGILEGGIILYQNRYKPICQTLNNKRTFVSLYDNTNKIPVFSAYKYPGKQEVPRQQKWKIEPQLEDETLNANMELEDKSKSYVHQADTRDYINTLGFEKGHLLPQSYGWDQNERRATFTLTNSVPQVNSFNTGSWSNVESCVKCVLDEYCMGNNDQTEGFVVIGARPGNNFLNNKVNIPSMLWSAFCCYSKSQGTWLAGAHWGDNIPDGGRVLQTKTLAQLHQELGGSSEAFPGTNCPLNTTVTHLYPPLSKFCKCPPPV
ncbi:endonuclease domain-containing 1 protein-like [Limanda limanda]|uniref:endonuclease domain-containing 1 protein-like n=1 Tax=Limanda limanda TaxID=27771 RepID=UPI0029C80647|nr:endonuclease domain-containing 1 protein-like [Limanda limanda]